MSMITEKTRVSKDFPIKVRFFFQKRNWYLFPQGFTCKGSFVKLKYDAKKSNGNYDVYSHDNFMIVENYHLTWLFMHFVFTSNLFKVSQQHFHHKRHIDFDDRKVMFKDSNSN